MRAAGEDEGLRTTLDVPQAEWLLERGSGATRSRARPPRPARLWLEALSDPRGSGGAFRVLVQERAVMPPALECRTMNDLEQRIAGAIAESRDELVELASALIRFDTTARDPGDPARDEAALQAHLAERLPPPAPRSRSGSRGPRTCAGARCRSRSTSTGARSWSRASPARAAGAACC